MLTPLTEKQRAIYEFIVERVERRGIPPTLKEIAAAFGLSSASGVADHLNAIERKGFIRRRPGLSRGIELLEAVRPRRAPGAAQVPVLGAIPARRRLSIARPSGRHLVVDRTVTPGATMAVRVDLADVAGYGIREGDYLILGKASGLRPGALAVAQLRDGTALVEVLSRQGTVRRLDTRTEILGEVDLLGEVLAVLRSMSEMDERKTYS